eukprot:992923-Prymnesium_polylepis.1
MTGVGLSATLVFEVPTARAVASHIVGRLDAGGAVGVGVPASHRAALLAPCRSTDVCSTSVSSLWRMLWVADDGVIRVQIARSSFAVRQWSWLLDRRGDGSRAVGAVHDAAPRQRPRRRAFGWYSSSTPPGLPVAG